ncbi:uncharacterized protein BDV17DRAFT_284889 [Aspergillus undulatus]|uniref:uncharacterized protein n=1 Tax=Aspergillus undulatus TaxID=1810928 RepID=UPI003CCCB1F3
MAKETVLITGCSDGGIGSGLALTFQQRGYHVFATARNPQKMSKLKDLPNVTFITLDICDKGQIAAAVDTVTAQTGGTLDHLVNNAGQGRFMPILDEDLEASKRLYDVNVWGPLSVTQAFSPLLIKARGKITFITSVAGHISSPYVGVYGSTKRALEILAETLRLEIAPLGVRVLAVTTGTVQSMGQVGTYDNYQLPEGSLYKPIEDIVASRAQGNDQFGRMDLMAYSEKVVTEITKGNSAKVWCGANAGFARFANSFVPQSILDNMVTRGTGLDVLASQRKDE